jgi:putative peptidoglycan lipid II flippase
LLKVATAVTLMAALLYFTMGEASWWLAAGWQKKLPGLAGLVVLGMAAYAACLALLGFRPRDFSRRAAT